MGQEYDAIPMRLVIESDTIPTGGVRPNAADRSVNYRNADYH